MIRQSDYENYDYRLFWKENNRDYEDRAERLAIRKCLKDIIQDEKIFADLGCGFGRLFNEYENFKKIFLVDYSLNNLKNAKSHVLEYLKNNKKESVFDNVFFIAADVNNLPFRDNLCDVCLTVRVIHHLTDPLKYFLEVSRVIKPKGIFVLEFANKRNLKNILRFFLKRLNGSPFSKKPLQIGQTILDYHPKFIKSALKQVNFKILKQISASNLRLSFLKRKINIKALLFFENFYQNLFSFIDIGPSIFLKTVFYNSKENKVVFKNNNIKNTNNISNNISNNNNSINIINTDTKTNSENIDIIENLSVRENIEDIFICPNCKIDALKVVNLSEIKNSFNITCFNCGKNFSYQDGIYNFKF